ncbi:MAG: hypothetical protein LBG58_08160, partial [Planctomycetaceae bacterium]|nr:hypothetical protein [Planctomycetaceae bacterium]
SSIPFSEHKRQKGDRVGHHWRIPGATGTRSVRHVLIDTNYWKTFVHARLGILMGDPGCLSLFGHDAKRFNIPDPPLLHKNRKINRPLHC